VSAPKKRETEREDEQIDADAKIDSSEQEQGSRDGAGSRNWSLEDAGVSGADQEMEIEDEKVVEAEEVGEGVTQVGEPELLEQNAALKIREHAVTPKEAGATTGTQQTTGEDGKIAILEERVVQLEGKVESLTHMLQGIEKAGAPQNQAW